MPIKVNDSAALILNIGWIKEGFCDQGSLFNVAGIGRLETYT